MQSVFGNLLHSRSGGEEKHSEKETQEKRGQRMGRGKWYIKLRKQQFFFSSGVWTLPAEFRELNCSQRNGCCDVTIWCYRQARTLKESQFPSMSIWIGSKELGIGTVNGVKIKLDYGVKHIYCQQFMHSKEYFQVQPRPFVHRWFMLPWRGGLGGFKKKSIP